MNPWAAVIGAALGGVKANAEDKQNQRDNRVNLTKEQWSPFTGVHGGEMKNADYMGRVMQGASSGAAMGQSMGGGSSSAPADGGNGQVTAQTQGAAFNGQGPTMAQQNGAPGSALGNYSSPQGNGYAPWRGGAGLTDPNPVSGVEIQGDPAISYPDQFGTGTDYPADYTGYDKDGNLISGGAKKPVNVGGKGQNFYKPKKVVAQNDARDQSGPPADYRVYPPEISSGSFNRAMPPTSINGVS